MGKKKKPKLDDPGQYARFVKVAEEHLGEDAEEKLEEAMKKILSKKTHENKPNSDLHDK